MTVLYRLRPPAPLNNMILLFRGMRRANDARHAAAVPVWQPWIAITAFALFLHFGWEMAQMPLYGTSPPADPMSVALCAQATVGDSVIALLAYGIVAAFSRRRLWLIAPGRGQYAGYLGLGLAATVAREWWNVAVRHSWEYTAAMPTVAGMGAAPLLQWVVLPPLTLWLARSAIEGRSLPPSAPLNDISR